MTAKSEFGGNESEFGKFWAIWCRKNPKYSKI